MEAPTLLAEPLDVTRPQQLGGAGGSQKDSPPSANRCVLSPDQDWLPHLSGWLPFCKDRLS